MYSNFFSKITLFLLFCKYKSTFLNYSDTKYQYIINLATTKSLDIDAKISRNGKMVFSGTHNTSSSNLAEAIMSIFYGMLPAEEDNPLNPEHSKLFSKDRVQILPYELKQKKKKRKVKK